jgi:hypothetical protein
MGPRPHPDGAARPALTSRAAHVVGRKAAQTPTATEGVPEELPTQFGTAGGARSPCCVRAII